MLLLLSTTDQTQRVVKRTTEKTASFQGARAAFESMTRRLGQATLNTYWRAHDNNIISKLAIFRFRRQSELQILSGSTDRIFSANTQLKGTLQQPSNLAYPTHCIFFQAPLGHTVEPISTARPDVHKFARLDTSLAGCGYFIEYGPEPDRPQVLGTAGLPSKYRFRLMEMTVPTEKLTFYQRPNNSTSPNSATDEKTMIDPRVYDMKNAYYNGLVAGKDRKSNTNWVPPLWMKEAIARDTIANTSPTAKKFRDTYVRAENIVALIILPKLAEKDRIIPGSNPPKFDPNQLELAPAYEFDSWRVIDGNPSVKDDRNRLVDNSARDNLLPPIIQVTMVAVDDLSMQKLNPSASNVPDLVGNLFSKATTVKDYEDDITSLERALSRQNIKYRIFSTDVVLRGSKWSRDPQ